MPAHSGTPLISAKAVGKLKVLQLHFRYMKGPTLGRNLINVNIVEKPMDIINLSEHKRGLTQEKNPMNVENVVKHSVVSVHSEYMKRLIPERNLMTVNNAVKPSDITPPSKCKRVHTGEKCYEHKSCGKTQF